MDTEHFDNRPIGVFDSGYGGLTVARALQKRLPEESILYFGDSARCPYGPRDQAEVDKYLADERCTFTFTLNAYYSMFSGILRLHDPAFLAKMPKDLPLLFLAGDADPVGEQGKGVQRAIQSLKDAGVQNIECKLYPGARHELLVETNHQEVFEDIGSWLEKHLA